MAKPPVSGQNSTSDHLNYQTWILRVSIHCDGCKKKVFKLLQSIDGVYKTVIDSQQNKVIVTGSVDGETLVQKLLKANKHAEILPESFKAPAAPVHNASENSKKKKKQSNKPKDCVTTGDDNNNDEHVDDGKKESEVAMADGNDAGKDQVQAQPTFAGAGDDGNGGGGGGKKKKKKKGKGDNYNNTTPTGDSEGVPVDNAPAYTGSTPATTENVGASMEQLNLSPPRHQMVYATPYDLPPYHNYYPAPAYGVSYSTSQPGSESSYYTPPVYGYAQSHPSVYYPVPPPLPSYGRSAFDDHDDENNDRRGCTIM